MKPEHLNGINSEKNVAITTDRQGGTNYRPPKAVNGVIPAYSRVAGGTQDGEGYQTLLPGANVLQPRRTRRNPRRRRQAREFCPFIGIAGAGIDLFSNRFFVARTDDDYGIVGHGRFAFGDTAWYNTVVDGAAVEIYNQDNSLVQSATLAAPVLYTGDAAARGDGEWVDLDGFYTTSLFSSDFSNDTFKIPFGFNQFLFQDQPLSSVNGIVSGDTIDAFVGNWSNVPNPGAPPNNRDNWVITVEIFEASNTNVTTSTTTKGVPYALAGQTRNLVYYDTDTTSTTSGTQVRTVAELGSRIGISPGVPSATYVVRTWEHATITNTNSLNRPITQQGYISFCPSDSGDATERAVSLADHEDEGIDFAFEGTYNPDTGSGATFTLDTPVNDPNGYVLTSQSNLSGTTVDYDFIETANPPGGSPLTVGQWIDLCEGLLGWNQTTYLRDIGDTGTFTPSDRATADSFGITSDLLDNMQDGLLNSFDIEGMSSTSGSPSSSTQHRNQNQLSFDTLNGYLVVDKGGDLYDVYNCTATASTQQPQVDTSGSPPNVAYSSLDLVLGSLILEDAPWFPAAVSGKDVWCARHAKAMGLTVDNSVVYSDEEATNVVIEIGSGGGS